MAWRLAQSLVALRNEVNAFAPRRSRASDGAIGDAAHRNRASRHNPNGVGVVTALDLTHDPGNGCDIHALADRLRRAPHPNLAYIISDRRIAGRSTGWAWHAYTGTNPHTRHAHFAVGVGPDGDPRDPYDDATPWGVASRGGPTGTRPDRTHTRPRPGATYTVQSGDTLSQIAAAVGADWRELARINDLADPRLIRVGQVLRLTAEPATEADPPRPDRPGAHTVEPGDTLSAIGKRYGVDWREIQRLNDLEDPDRLSVGQVLRLP